MRLHTHKNDGSLDSYLPFDQVFRHLSQKLTIRMSSVEIDLAIPIEREIGKAAATWYQFRNEGAQHQQHQGINDTKKQRFAHQKTLQLS